MRLIDADEYAKEMKCRQNAVKTAIEHPRTDVYYTDKEHWEGVLCTYAEAKLTLDNMPTVDAVPLDKLCKWLGEHHAYYSYFVMDRFAWRKVLTEWMEGLNESD